MPLTVREFSRLLAQCQLLEPEQCRKWLAEYAKQRGLEPDSAADGLGAWLVENGAISAYQARVLLAGQAGPFVYGAYRVFDRIASGRLAGLFRAVHVPTQHPVALWFLSGPALSEAAVVASLREQCRRVSQACVARPQLARPWQLVDLGLFKFAVLEDLAGECLEESACLRQALAPAEACRYVWHAARGVAALHAAGLVHGDVRPANLLVKSQGLVKLLHFPLAPDPLAPPLHARLAQAASKGDAPPEADYLAPEVALGQPFGPAADIYSLGCTLYRLLAGRVLFPNGSAAEKLARHTQQMPPPLQQLVPGVPAALAQCVALMLAKNPQHRLPSAEKVCEALGPFVDARRLDVPAQVSPSDEAFQRAIVAEEPGQAAVAAHGMPVAQAPIVAPPAPVPIQVPPPAAGARSPQVQGSPLHAAQPLSSPGTMPQPILAPPPTQAPAAQSAAVGFAGAVQAGAPLVAPPAGAASSGLARVRRARDRSQLPVIIGSVGAAIAAIAAFAYFMSTGDSEKPPQAPQTVDARPSRSSRAPDAAPRGNKPSRTAEADGAADASGSAQQSEGPPVPPRVDTAAGVDEPLWELPRHGQPIVLEWLPPGPQMVVVLRPQRLLAHPEGEKLLDPRTLGPLATLLTEQVPKLVGLPLGRIERLVAGIYDMSPDPIEVSLVAYAADELVLDKLRTAWGNPDPAEVKGPDGSTAAAWQREGRAWWLPAGEQARAVVALPQAALADTVAAGNAPAVLRRQLELLLLTSDREHEFTLLAAPDFLFTGGKALLSGPAEKLKQPLDDFFTFRTDNGEFELPKGVMLSAALDERLFIELRIDNSSSVRPSPILAREYLAKVRGLSRQVNSYLRSLYLSPYSKEVLWDFADRLTALGRLTTSGIDENQVVLRAYLPAKAAHNLVLNSYLALLETPGGAPAVAVAGSGNHATAPLTAAQRLDKRMPLSFPRNTLERSLEMVSEEIGVPIIILGTDLQVEGITKNQSFGMDEAEQPAREILLKILAKADPAGRLVYVIKPRQEDGQEVLYITTRAAAEKRQDPIPPEFAAAPQKK